VSTPLCTGLGRRDDILHLELAADSKTTWPLVPGKEFAFELDGGRRCVGSRPPGSPSLVACPTQASGISANQCPDCFAASVILPCHRCEGDRCANPARRGDCVQPDNHAVYLASFGPGAFKVGVARWDRRRERLLEQGARAAIIVARDDGQKVRRIESQVKRLRADDGTRPIPDKRNFHDKLLLMTHAASRQQLTEELVALWPTVKPRVLGQFLPAVEIVDLPALALLGQVPRVLSAAADLRVRGTIASVAGQTLLIDSDSGEQVALDAAGLVGYRLRSLDAGEVGVGQLALGF
jgi:hypothetical protein